MKSKERKERKEQENNKEGFQATNRVAIHVNKQAHIYVHGLKNKDNNIHVHVYGIAKLYKIHTLYPKVEIIYLLEKKPFCISDERS